MVYARAKQMRSWRVGTAESFLMIERTMPSSAAADVDVDLNVD